MAVAHGHHLAVENVPHLVATTYSRKYKEYKTGAVGGNGEMGAVADASGGGL